MRSEDTIRARFEADRRALLDLSLRNTLISHRELKSRGLRVVDERSDQLFRILVSDGRAMSFLPAPKSESLEDELNEGQLLFEQPPEDDGVADRHTDDRLQTPYSDPTLQRRLLNTFYAARTHIEERGVNVLYLALGILHWYESPSSEIERRAPRCPLSRAEQLEAVDFASTPRSSFGIPGRAADPEHATAQTYRPAVESWSSSARRRSKS